MKARMPHFRTSGCGLAVAVCFTIGFAGCQSAKNDQAVVRNVERSSAPPSAGAKAAAENARKPEEVPDAKSPEILPDTHRAAGRLHESQGHYDRAVEQYRLVTALSPKDYESYNRLGICLDHLSRFAEADQAFQMAIKLAPKQAYLHNNLAFSYITQNRWKDAEGPLKEAVALKPDFIRARVNLGMVLAQQDKFDDAMVQFDHALKKGDAYYNMGLMYQSRRKVALAASAFKTALQHDPQLAAAQKRLDTLPPDVVKSAGTLPIATASPAAGTAQVPAAEKSARPAPQPVSVPSVSPAARVEPKAVETKSEPRTRGQELVWQMPESDVAADRKEVKTSEKIIESKVTPAPVKVEKPVEIKPSKFESQTRSPVEQKVESKDISSKYEKESMAAKNRASKSEVKSSSETVVTKKDERPADKTVTDKTSKTINDKKSEEKPASSKVAAAKGDDKPAPVSRPEVKATPVVTEKRESSPRKVEEKAVPSRKHETASVSKSDSKAITASKHEEPRNDKSNTQAGAKSPVTVKTEVSKPAGKVESKTEQPKNKSATPFAPSFMYSPFAPLLMPAPSTAKPSARTVAPAPVVAPVAKPSPSAQSAVEPQEMIDEGCIESQLAEDLEMMYSPDPFEILEPEPDFSTMDFSTVDFSLFDLFVSPVESHSVQVEESVALSFDTPVSVILDAEFASIPKAAAAASNLPADILDPCPSHESLLLNPSVQM